MESSNTMKLTTNNVLLVSCVCLNLLTLFVVTQSPAKQEFVCRGIVENPNAVRCFEQ